MANKKISDLTAATTLDGTESIEIVQSGSSKKTTLADLPISDDVSTALAGKSDTGHTHSGVYQPASANLDEYAAVNPTTAGLALLDDADAAAQRTTLGLGDSATKNTGTSAGTVAAGDHAHSGVYEPALGNPAGNGYVLSSTTGGTRSWVSIGGGGGGDMYKATYDADNDGKVDAAEDSDKLAGTTPTSAGLALLDDADAAAQRTTLGLGEAATKNTGTSAGTVAAGDHAHSGVYQPASANLDEYAAVNPTAAGLALLDDADAAAQRTTLGLGEAATKNTGTSAGTVAAGDHAHSGVYQPASANLDEYAAVNPTTAGLALLDDADNAAQRTTLGLGTMAVEAATDYAKVSATADMEMNNRKITEIKTASFASAATVTVTIASPGVMTWAGHNFAANDTIVLSTSGALPTGLSANTIYFVRNPAADTFELSATSGGASINTSGSQSGTHKARISTSATSGTINIDWTKSLRYIQPEPTGTITYTFTDPPGPCHLELKIESDGTSTAQTINLPTVTQYGTAWSGANNKKAILSFSFDGVGYDFMGSNQV